MKKLNVLILLLFSFAILSCGPRVATQKMTSKDLSRYDTFAFLPNANVNVEGMQMNSEDVSRAIVESVNRNLRQVGYELDRESPDLLVLISTETDTEVTTTTDPVYATYPYTMGVTTVSPFYDPYYYPGYAGYSNFVGYDVDTYTYEEGTVVINLVDRETKNTVWKGVASESVLGQGITEEIRELVNSIFEEYPLMN